MIFISHALKVNDISKKIYTLIEHKVLTQKLLCINCNDETLLTHFVTYYFVIIINGTNFSEHTYNYSKSIVEVTIDSLVNMHTCSMCIYSRTSVIPTH